MRIRRLNISFFRDISDENNGDDDDENVQSNQKHNFLGHSPTWAILIQRVLKAIVHPAKLQKTGIFCQQGQIEFANIANPCVYRYNKYPIANA